MEKVKYQTISTVIWVALLVHSTNLPRGSLKYNDHYGCHLLHVRFFSQEYNVHWLSVSIIIINRLGSAMPVYAIHRSDLTMGFNINSA